MIARLLPPKVIAVFATTRAEAECALRHARTGSSLPVWVYCAESAEPLEDCQRFVSGDLFSFARDLTRVWVALSIVAWTGGLRGLVLKLFPFLLPPFRIVVLNEAGGFFAAASPHLAAHVGRRTRDAAVGSLRRLRDWTFGGFAWTGSVLYRTGERIADLPGMIYSFAYRSGEWFVNAARQTWSLAYRSGEGIFNVCRLGWSLLHRAAVRALALSRWFVEFALARFAVLARWTPPLSRYAVARVKSRQPPVEPGDAGASIEIRIPGRRWPRQAVMRALADSDAEFLVFRQGHESRSADTLIRIARNTGAFAVARQIAYSAWRPTVLPRHPFRALQDGEISEVYAPFSSLLVIRREAFLHLGCPRSVTFGSALALLFWKASAAGLRTLVSGHEDPVTDEPAMPLEDAEFALRLTLSRELKRLQPLNPHRLRGNLASSLAHIREFRGKPRVLIVSPYLPFPLTHGGAVRIYNLCRELADDVDFVLACFREAGETVCYNELHEVFREVYIVDADQKHTDPDVPKQAAEYRNAAMADLIRRLCLARHVDVVQLEYTQMAEYRDHTGAVPVILVEHDITFTLHRQIADLTGDIGACREYALWQSFERQALQCCNTIWTMSEHDKRIALKYGASAARTAVVPNGVDLKRFHPEPKRAGPPTVLFVGSFRHLPNLLAYEALRDTIMPAVWENFPAAILHVIAGRGGETVPLPDPRILIEGFVEDVRSAYRNADVIAIPLPLSAGTNIKLMEAMACGRAVVSTPQGCAGMDLIDGQELLIAELEPGFAEAIKLLLANENTRSRIALEGRRTAEQRFGWDAIAQDALKFYRNSSQPIPRNSAVRQ